MDFRSVGVMISTGTGMILHSHRMLTSAAFSAQHRTPAAHRFTSRLKAKPAICSTTRAPAILQTSHFEYSLDQTRRPTLWCQMGIAAPCSTMCSNDWLRTGEAARWNILRRIDSWKRFRSTGPRASVSYSISMRIVTNVSTMPSRAQNNWKCCDVSRARQLQS